MTKPYKDPDKKYEIAEELWPAIKAIVEETYDEFSMTARLYRYSILKKAEINDLKAQIKYWEDKEVDRASCCFENEQENIKLNEEIKQLKEAYDKLDDANIKYYEENKKLKYEYALLIRHAWLCAAISKAKAAELLEVPLIDFDVKINEVLKDESSR